MYKSENFCGIKSIVWDTYFTSYPTLKDMIEAAKKEFPNTKFSNIKIDIGGMHDGNEISLSKRVRYKFNKNLKSVVWEKDTSGFTYLDEMIKVAKKEFPNTPFSDLEISGGGLLYDENGLTLNKKLGLS